LCIPTFAAAGGPLPQQPDGSGPVSGGRELHLRWLQPQALYAANSLFVSDYLTTKGQTPEDDYRMIAETKPWAKLTNIDWSQFLPVNADPFFGSTNKTPYSANFMFSIQRELAPNMVITASYVGTRGHNMLVLQQANPGDPGLCLSVSQTSQVAPGSATCGPFGENGVYTRADGTGYIVSVDQLPGDSMFTLYRREGEPGRPHDHSRIVLRFSGGADATDGLEVTSTPLGLEFPAGLLVAMNSRAKNFLMYDWSVVAAAMLQLRPPSR
jgi:hypothetical protein